MKTRLLATLGLVSVSLGGLLVAEDAYAFTGLCGPFDSTSWGALGQDYCRVTYGNTEIGLSTVQGRLGNNHSVVEAFINNDGSAFLNVDSYVSGDFFRSTGWAMSPTHSDTAVAHCESPSWNSSAQTVKGPTSGSGGYACFLVILTDFNGHNDWQSWSDAAAISYNGDGTATLQCTGNSYATMACMPISHYLGSVSQGSTSQDLLNSDLGGADWTHNKICTLRGINGAFTSNTSPAGHTAGVSAYVDGNGEWRFDTTAGTGGVVDCYY